MAQYDINLREYWRILKKRKFIVIFTAIVLGVFTTVFTFLRAPIPLYTSVCSIKFEKDTTVEGLYAKTLSWSGGDDIETQISVLKSYSVMQKVAEILRKIPKSASTGNSQLQSNLPAVVQGLQSKVAVSREPFTNIINIQVTDTDPGFAQRLANTMASTYREMHAKEQNKRTVDALKYIADQLKKVRQQLREAEEEFNRFTQKHQLVSIDLQSENLLLRAKEIKDETRKLQGARTELKDVLVKLDQFIKNPSGSDSNFYSSYANKQYQDTNTAMVDLLLKRDSLLKDYTDRHPEVIEISRRIIENARKMTIMLRLQINNIDKNRRDLKNELVNVDKKTGELMEKKLEFDRLKRKVDSFNNMTVLLENKSQEASIREAEKPDEITIVRPAFMPTSPINPPKTASTGAMGVIIGIILGMVIAFIIETFDTSLGAIEDVEETIGTQVLGVIPHGDAKIVQEALKDKDQNESTTSSLKRKMRLVSHFVPQTVLAESFRSLRTNIQFRDVEKNIKSLAVTSASPQEGKTMIAANLAITMAQAGMKTLLVESDLRKPTISRAFGIEIAPGLSEILLGNYSWRDVTKTITDIIIGKMGLDDVMTTPGLDNLHIITSGTIPPNPSELIDSKRLIDFIEEAKKDYDIIILDTPPILSTADPAILGTKVDAVLLVYRLGSISRGLLKRSVVQLSQVKCNIMGVVLNDMKAEVSPDFQDFKYYKYYYSEGKKRKTEKKRGKKFGFLKLMLGLTALCLLIVGLLWQNGLLPIDTYLFKKQITFKKPSAPSLPTPSPTQLPETKPLHPTKAPAAAPASVKTSPSPAHKASKEDLNLSHAPSVRYPYSLRTGSFKTLKQVEESIALLKDKGLSPYWTQIDLGEKGKWFRVFVGYFSTKDNAREFKERHEISADRILKTAYAVQIGEYSSNEVLNHKISSLKKKGYSPYFIGDPQKKYRLLIGAFVTKKAAGELALNLKENGIDCKVVLR